MNQATNTLQETIQQRLNVQEYEYPRKHDRWWLTCFAEMYDLGINTVVKLTKAMEIITANKSDAEFIGHSLAELIDGSPSELPYNPYRRKLRELEYAELKRLLGQQSIPNTEVSIMLSRIFSEHTHDNFSIALHAYNYGVIMGKRADRKRRKMKG